MSAPQRDISALEAALREELGERDGEAKHPYRMTESGIWWLRPDKDHRDPVPVRLANFQARIVRDVIEDDDLEQRHLFEVEGRLGAGQPSARQAVPAAQFASLNWVHELLGARAILEPGSSLKDRARAAIQYLSGDIEQAHVYTHTGWRRLPGGEHVYLHAGGAVGSKGAAAKVEVSPPQALARFRLPDPPAGEAERRAVRASLAIADPEVIPDRLSMPVLAAAYRAPLGPIDASLLLIGESGIGKSELAALAQQHYGAELERKQLAANFGSTGNYLLGIAFVAKDALLVVDDFKPTGSRIDRQRAHAEANRLLTAQGNQSGRGRAEPGGAPRAIRDPRGLLLVTGEEVPEGYSARSRSLILEVGRGEIDGLGLRPGEEGYRETHPRFTQLQEAGAGDDYARALAGYLRWLALRIAEMPAQVRRRVAELRCQVRAGHARTGNNVAELMVGVERFLDYARSIEAVSAEEAEAWRERAWKALLEAASRQDRHQQRVRPELRFLELVSSALGSGRAHVAALDGFAPEPPEAFGWRPRLVGVGDNAEQRWEPQGDRLGWVEGPDLYLDRNAAYRAAALMDGETGVGVSPETLTKRLHEAGFLASTSGEKDGRLTLRKTCEGRQARVLHLRAETLGLSLVGQTGITGKTGTLPPSASSDAATSASRSVDLELETGKPTGKEPTAAPSDSRFSFPVLPGDSTPTGTEKAVLEGSSELGVESIVPVVPVIPVGRDTKGVNSEGATDAAAPDAGEDEWEVRL